MIGKTWTALMALGLAACAGVERANLTEFEPLTDHGFRYESGADSISYPPDDPSAEAKRMEWLQSYLDDNALCPNGYTITERKAVLDQHAIIGTGYRIFYRGECN